jgi:hypothetical protein
MSAVLTAMLRASLSAVIIAEPEVSAHGDEIMRALIERCGSRSPLGQGCKISSHCRGIGMVGAERFLVDRQRALEEWSRPGEITLVL